LEPILNQIKLQNLKNSLEPKALYIYINSKPSKGSIKQREKIKTKIQGLLKNKETRQH
jgi:hypothetical protein